MIVGVTTLLGVITTTLQLASFFNTDPWNKAKDYRESDLLGLLQSMLVQWLALFLASLPIIQNGFLRQPWILGLSSVALLTATLAPALYGSLGPAWPNLLLFFSSLSQAQTVLQLLRGLQVEIALPKRGINVGWTSASCWIVISLGPPSLHTSTPPHTSHLHCDSNVYIYTHDRTQANCSDRYTSNGASKQMTLVFHSGLLS